MDTNQSTNLTSALPHINLKPWFNPCVGLVLKICKKFIKNLKTNFDFYKNPISKSVTVRGATRGKLKSGPHLSQSQGSTFFLSPNSPQSGGKVLSVTLSLITYHTLGSGRCVSCLLESLVDYRVDFWSFFDEF